jgi:hypothetical protein
VTMKHNECGSFGRSRLLQHVTRVWNFSHPDRVLADGHESEVVCERAMEMMRD